GRDAGPASATEGGEASVPPVVPPGSIKELFVTRVRAGPAAFYIGEAKRIEPLSHAQLVLDRQAEPERLAAVTQRGVEERYLHGCILPLSNDRVTRRRNPVC